MIHQAFYLVPSETHQLYIQDTSFFFICQFHLMFSLCSFLIEMLMILGERDYDGGLFWRLYNSITSVCPPNLLYTYPVLSFLLSHLSLISSLLLSYIFFTFHSSYGPIFILSLYTWSWYERSRYHTSTNLGRKRELERLDNFSLIMWFFFTFQHSWDQV